MTPEEIWRRKTDDELAVALERLGEYTEEGQDVIRAEAERRRAPAYRAEQARRDGEYQQRLRTDEVSLSGIRGWLLLPAIGLVATAVIDIVAAVSNWSYLSGGEIRALEARSFGLRTFVVTDTYLRTVFIALTAVVAAGFFAKRPWARKFMIVWFLVNLAIQIRMVLSAYSVLNSPFIETAVRDLFAAVVAAAIWVPYFLVSRRVRNTFTRPRAA
jgi:hypothetical protein